MQCRECIKVAVAIFMMEATSQFPLDRDDDSEDYGSRVLCETQSSGQEMAECQECNSVMHIILLGLLVSRG